MAREMARSKEGVADADDDAASIVYLQMKVEEKTKVH